MLDQALTSVWACGVPAGGVVVDARRSEVAEAIAAEARSWHAEVMVVARRPRAAIGVLLLGSLSNQIMRAAGCPLTTRIAAGLPPVDVDTTVICRVLTNLVQNAIRHSPKDSPITLSARLTAPDTIEVSVTDQGSGVSPSRRDEIFTLFARRADDAGAGLGLTIAKTFVEAHGQRIWVADAPGGGARFCFTLPVAAGVTEERELAADSHRR